MKFLHVSDIHLGKRLHGGNLTEDHAHILDQMLALAARSDVDAVLIAGDVYNRSQPQPEAIVQFSRFLTRLAALRKPVLIVRGNHDGEAQLAYAAPLLSDQGLYFSDVFDGTMQCVTLNDEFGALKVWLMPYLKPIQVRRFFPEKEIETYADAVRTVIEQAQIDRSERNVLVTHQYVFGAQVSDSEERSVGGLDQIPASVFEAFDYVALGHLHKPQTMDGGRLRYCGAPLVYSFDECSHSKSATLVTVGEKGVTNEFELVPFEPLHACRRLEGTLAELSAQPRSEDYVQVLITDKVRPLDPIGTLRLTYPNLMNLQFAIDEGESAWDNVNVNAHAVDPMEHFSEFYTAQNGRAPTEEQMEIIREIIREGGEEA